MSGKFVLADSRKCIGCKACMAACLVKHFVPNDVPVSRLHVVEDGDGMTAPIICHHCDSAPCVAVCPTGALYGDGDRVGVRMLRCIGCRSCEIACPYGAVSVVDRFESTHLGDLSVGSLPRAVVVKCDRCFDRVNGPACVEACTSNALSIVDQDQIDTLQKERKGNWADSLA